MAVYTPHGESIVRTIFRKSRTSYEGYASPPADILARVDEFLTCSDWSRGVARVKCTACDYSYFRPFSCKTFHLCPSCDQKRTILYAEYLAEELLLELPHRQFVFTVPKILRPYFKNDKRLFGEVSRLIFELLSGFFSLAAQRQLLCGCVASYQSFGEFARFHPHWHVLVLEGGFDEWGRFVYLPLGCDAGLLKLWQESILALFLKQKLIEQDRAAMIRSWVHSGFSVESETRMLDKGTKEALGQYAVRGAVSEQRISYDSAADVVTWSARANGYFDGKIETFKGLATPLRGLRPENPYRILHPNVLRSPTFRRVERSWFGGMESIPVESGQIGLICRRLRGSPQKDGPKPTRPNWNLPRTAPKVPNSPKCPTPGPVCARRIGRDCSRRSTRSTRSSARTVAEPWSWWG